MTGGKKTIDLSFRPFRSTDTLHPTDNLSAPLRRLCSVSRVDNETSSLGSTE